MVFCNRCNTSPTSSYYNVTILILIDGFLQLQRLLRKKSSKYSHNPYFNRWFSAIQDELLDIRECKVTILILIDGFLQCEKVNGKVRVKCVTILILIDGFLQSVIYGASSSSCFRHNPYFNRWFSAMKRTLQYP